LINSIVYDSSDADGVGGGVVSRFNLICLSCGTVGGGGMRSLIPLTSLSCGGGGGGGGGVAGVASTGCSDGVGFS
jgi:hypothetical protein